MKNKQAHKLLIIIIGLALILSMLPVTGHTAIPQKINYQGYLTDPQGTVIDATVSMVFSIYSQASGGTALWTETQTVTVTDGVFSTNLGYTNPITLPFDTPYYLGITIGSDNEMTPRQALTTVAYAFRAKEADNVKDGAVTNTVISEGAVTTDKISDDAITGDKIAPAAVTSTNIANGSVGSGQIVDGSIATQDLADDTLSVDKIIPNILSSIDGVSNDGGNVDLEAGSNITITPDDDAYKITISSSGGGGDSLWKESGGNVYRDSGNVGIGTTNPLAKLSFGADPFTPRKIALWDEVNNFYGFGIFPGQLTFLTNDTAKMTILDNGNVGIGTSFPNSKLAVEGKSGDYALININQQGDPMWTGLRLDRSGTEKWLIGMSHVNDDLLFRRSASSSDMVIDHSGNVGIAGDVGIYGNLTVFGSKGFAQPHPGDPSKQIVYVCLEGGESGVYVRGTSELKNGRIEIDLPEHFVLVASEDGLTVQVTPLGDCFGLFVHEKTLDRIVIRESKGGKSSIRFDYLVMGIRRGFENHKVIQEKMQHQAKFRHD